jgi:acetylcholinesterase
MCSAFGFLGGKEVKDAGLGNAGLHDRTLSFFALLKCLPHSVSLEIAALEWVQTHISKFGGDPKQVTM